MQQKLLRGELHLRVTVPGTARHNVIQLHRSKRRERQEKTKEKKREREKGRKKEKNQHRPEH